MTARYTLKKLTDVEDSAPKFGYDELQEATVDAIPFAPVRVLELGVGTVGPAVHRARLLERIKRTSHMRKDKVDTLTQAVLLCLGGTSASRCQFQRSCSDWNRIIVEAAGCWTNLRTWLKSCRKVESTC